MTGGWTIILLAIIAWLFIIAIAAPFFLAIIAWLFIIAISAPFFL